MKYIYYTNKIILITTLVLYLTYYLGLYAQIVLGIVQVISALLLLFQWELFTKKIKIKLFYYYSLVIIYGFCWFLDWTLSDNDVFIILVVMIIPMSIAIYFFSILYKIYKS